MRLSTESRGIGLLAVAALFCVSLMQPALAQSPAPASNLTDQLGGLDTPVEIDVAALREQVVERIKSKADATASRRPPVLPQLLKLPQFNFDVVFDPDSSVIRPQSYQTIGRIADALSDPKMLPYAFLVVDHTEATGRRENNLTLSQRRADSIRAVLVGSFKIASQRLQALGLGEEQLQDTARPASPANIRAQIVAIGKLPPPVVSQPAPGAVAPAKKGSAAPAKKRN